MLFEFTEGGGPAGVRVGDVTKNSAEEERDLLRRMKNVAL